MRALPETITVYGLPFSVKFYSDTKSAPDLECGAIWGRLCMREGVLHVDATTEEHATRNTFLHELIHVCDKQTSNEADTLSEAQVERLATGLQSFLLANREYVAWLQAISPEPPIRENAADLSDNLTLDDQL